MRLNKESGSATILAFGLTIMILALAMGFLMSALVEKKASYNYLDTVTARMAAQTAIERAVASVNSAEGHPISYSDLYSDNSSVLNAEEKEDLIRHLKTSYNGIAYISKITAEDLVNSDSLNWIYNLSNDSRPKYISRMAYAVIGSPVYSSDTPQYPDAYYSNPDNIPPKLGNPAYRNSLYQRFNLARNDWNNLEVEDFFINDTPWSKDAPPSNTIKYLREFNDGAGTFPDAETRRKQIIANLIDYCDANNIPTGDDSENPTYLGLEKVPYINRVVFEIAGTIIYESEGGGGEDPEDPEDPYEYGDMPWWWPQPTNPSSWPCQNWPWPPNGKPTWWPASWTWPPDENAHPAPWGWWTPWDASNSWYVWDWKTGPYPGAIESGFSPPDNYLFRKATPNWWPPEWPWPPLYCPTPPSWWPDDWRWPPMNGWEYDKSLSIYNSSPPPWTPPNLPTNPWPWPDGPNSSDWPPPSPEARPDWWPASWPWPPLSKPSWWDSQGNWFWPPGEWKSWLTPLPPWGSNNLEWYWETGPMGYYYTKNAPNWWPTAGRNPRSRSNSWPWPPPYPGKPSWWPTGGAWPPSGNPWSNANNVPDIDWYDGWVVGGDAVESYYHFSASITPKIQTANLYDAHLGVKARLEFDINISYAIDGSGTESTSYPGEGDPVYIQKDSSPFPAKSYGGINFDDIVLNTEITSGEKDNVAITVTISNLKVRLLDDAGNLLDYANVTGSKNFTFQNIPLNQDEFKFYLSFETADPRQNHNIGDWSDGSCLESARLSYNPAFPAYFDDLSNSNNHNKAYLTARSLFGAASETDTERTDIAPCQISTVNFEFPEGNMLQGVKNAPMADIFELGLIHRADSFRTLNLKIFNPSNDYAYSNGDAEIINQVKIGSDNEREITANLNSRDRGRLAELFNLEVESDTGRGITDAMLSSLPGELYISRVEILSSEEAVSEYLRQKMMPDQTKGDIYMEIMTGALNDAEALPFERFYVVAIGQAIKDVQGFRGSQHGQFDHGVDRVLSTQKIIAEVIKDPGDNRYKIARIRYLEE